LASLFSDNEDDYRIVVTDAERTRLNDQWQAQMGRAPTDQELRGLIEQWIREEIYYREALRMGLDANDTIIRRRLAQKLTFLTEDVASASAPSKETLQAYFADNAERYTIPEQTSFRHRYFSVERREDARADAVAALADESNGDPFILQLAFDLHSERQIADLFGSDFASTMRRLDGSGWQGPLQSAYGWHLVSIEQRTPARVPGFDEVARNVAIDHKQELRRQANERYFETLRNRYEISGS
jgi:peptidyl-prolyl cis-trans isomerase C